MTVIQAWSSSIILLLLLYANFEIWSLVISSIVSVFLGYFMAGLSWINQNGMKKLKLILFSAKK